MTTVYVLVETAFAPTGEVDLLLETVSGPGGILMLLSKLVVVCSVDCVCWSLADVDVSVTALDE